MARKKLLASTMPLCGCITIATVTRVVVGFSSCSHIASQIARYIASSALKTNSHEARSPARNSASHGWRDGTMAAFAAVTDIAQACSR